MTKAKQSAIRHGVIQVHEHCPRRPYLELVVPPEALAVTSATFVTDSRDQGKRLLVLQCGQVAVS